jgi:hypothetical protein
VNIKQQTLWAEHVGFIAACVHAYVLSAVSDYNAFTNRATSYVVRLDVKERYPNWCMLVICLYVFQNRFLFFLTSTLSASFAFVFTTFFFCSTVMSLLPPAIYFCSYLPFCSLPFYIFFSLLDVTFSLFTHPFYFHISSPVWGPG